VPGARRLRAFALGVALLAAAAPAPAEDECLMRVKSAHVTIADNGSLCGVAENKACVFQLQLCLNQQSAGCPAAPIKKKVKAKGNCGAVGKLRVAPQDTDYVCGSVVGVKVKTKKKGRKEGTCRITVATRSSDKPARRDVEKVTLVCKPNPGDCPARVGVGTTTTTTLPCLAPCDCCVQPVTELGRCVR
jgi:hypothetical protein